MIKAVGKRLIVKQAEEQEQSKKLIIEVTSRSPIKAFVIALGSEVDVQISVGDLVVMPSHTGTPLEIEEEKYLAIYEDQILAVVGK